MVMFLYIRVSFVKGRGSGKTRILVQGGKIKIYDFKKYN
jgi:hypothetical protein